MSRPSWKIASPAVCRIAAVESGCSAATPPYTWQAGPAQRS